MQQLADLLLPTIPESFQDLGQRAAGRAEVLATLGTGMAGSIPAGYGGLLELARTGDPQAAAQLTQEIQQGLTYMPRTEMGQEYLQDVSGPLEMLAAPSEAIGQATLEAFDSPLAATGAEIFADPLEYLLPGLKGLAATGPLIARSAPKGARAHALPDQFLVEGSGEKATTPVVQSFTPRNTDKVLAQVETVRQTNPQPLASPEAWLSMEEQAFGGDYLPAPPMRAIEYAQDPQKLADQIQKLSPEMKAAVDEGFGYVQSIRDIYNSRSADPSLTGRLFMWGILSRGAGPVQQEAAFIDILENAQPYIEKAARGEFTEADLDSWKDMVSQSLPEGSPAKQVTMNANAAGKLLFELSKVPEGSSQSVMARLHDMLSDPETSGRDFRREFFRLTDKPGIDNKVVSFIGLVGGKDDMLVMDRIQTSNLWDDGRFGGKNIYDPKTGGLASIMGGPRGLLVTESLEDGLRDSVQEAYNIVGRPQDASLGRAHWETWVVRGNQAVSHSTLQSVRTGSQVGGAVTEGKPGTFSSGTTYRQTVNGPITEYPLSDGSMVRMTPEQQKDFEAYIKKPSSGIVPKGFKVSQAVERPWYEMPGVDRSKLDEAARQFENANADGSLKSGAARPQQGRRTVSERRGDFLRAIRADRANLSGGVDAGDPRGPSGPYTRGSGSTDEGVGLLTFEPTPAVAEQYEFAGLSIPRVYQEPTTAQNAIQYNAEMQASLRDNPTAPQVEIKSPEELQTMNLFRTESGSGFAIKPDGDVVAVFASPAEKPGGAYAMLDAAVQAGGRKLDAFDTYLPRIYETVGFRPVAKLKWNDEYAPEGWDKETFKAYNNGEPDVVFFVYDPDYMGSGGAKNIPYVDEYDDAVAIQNSEVRKLESRVREIVGQ